MNCAAIMTAKPAVLRESDSVAAAAEALVAGGCGDLPVVDGEGRFVGLFGIGDLLALVVPRVALAGDLKPNLRFVGDDPKELSKKFAAVKHKSTGECCNRQAVTLDPETPEIEAIRLVCRGHATLPVVDRGTRKLAGIVTCRDTVRAIARAADAS